MSRLMFPKAVLSLAFASTALPMLAAQEAEPQPAPVLVTEMTPVDTQEAQEGPVLVPAISQTSFGRSIEDIQLHRMTPSPYVRRLADVVKVGLGDVDLDADVIMTVGDTPITRNDFRKRAIMFLGVNRVDEEITRLVTETQRAAQIAAGIDPASLVISEADLDEKVQNIVSMVEMQARGPNAEAEPEKAAELAAKARAEFIASIESSMGMEAYRQMMSAEVAFEKVFLPMPTEPQEGEVWGIGDGPIPEDDPKPDWMPQITWDALGTNDSGMQLRTFVKSHGKSGKPIPSFFRGQITTTIRTGVIAAIGVKFFFDTDLPDDVFLRLGDADLGVDGLWDMIKDDISDTDVNLILRELLTLHGVRTTLGAVDQWMDEEETKQAYADLNAQFEGTLFPLGSIIVLRGYRSLDRYREHWRHKEAYFRWRKKSLSTDEVEEHYRTSGRLFFERGSAEVDLIYSRIAQDGGFGESLFAETTAALAAALDTLGEDSGPDDFKELAKIFPRPPTRQTQTSDAQADRYFQRNPLRIRLTESEMSIFIDGYSLADDIYYHGVPGEVFAPVAMRNRRHAWGAELNAGSWAGRLNGFTRDRPLSPLQGRDEDQAIEDYLDLNYQYWAQECLKSVLAKVKVATK